MIGFDAPMSSSGKTLLARAVSLIATGREPVLMTYTADPDEDRKRIVSALAAGDPVICLDNISRPLEGDAFCSVLTSPEFHDRRLGSNELLRVPTCATWIGTANNLVVRGDMAKRVVVARIDPGVERPEERTFDRDLLVFVRTHRHHLVHQALTLLRAYIAAGRPRQAIKAFGRFEAWSDLVRSALIWAGCDDPCVTRERLERDDPITQNVSAVLTALHQEFRGKQFSTSDVLNAVRNDGNKGMSPSAPSPLQTALEMALPHGEIKGQALGHWLRRHKDRIVEGLRLRKLEDYRGSSLWQVEDLRP
jgi:hypothetical protein